MGCGVDLCDFGPIQILLNAGGVVDINKILCCITLLLMMFTSEYEPDILIIICAQTILSNERTGVHLRSLGHESEIQMTHLRLRALNVLMIGRRLLIIVVESLLVVHLGCLHMRMISQLA